MCQGVRLMNRAIVEIEVQTTVAVKIHYSSDEISEGTFTEYFKAYPTKDGLPQTKTVLVSFTKTEPLPKDTLFLSASIVAGTLK